MATIMAFHMTSEAKNEMAMTAHNTQEHDMIVMDIPSDLLNH
jgi:hypothetical protein